MSGKKDNKPKKKTDYFTDCGWCGARQGSIRDIKKHRPCGCCKLTYYCSKGCQRIHWKEGHKKNCLAPENRTVALMDQSVVKPKGSTNEASFCPICLESCEWDSQTLKCCKSKFHKACLDELRKYENKCPICRQSLPKSSEEMNKEAILLFTRLKFELEHSKKQWDQLNERQKKQMKSVLHLLSRSAKQGYAKSQFNLGQIYNHGHGVPNNYDQAFYWFN